AGLRQNPPVSVIREGPLDQPILFRDEELPQRPLHDPDAARTRLSDMLGRMQAAASWPWKDATVRHYREALWPSLLARLPETGEAGRLRAEIDAECARLDAAARQPCNAPSNSSNSLT
ncbi:MAG: hypothetical protein ACRETD_13730, partial [Steroidobacteraceae bacterium]